MTLRKLEQMYEGRDRDRWVHTSHVLWSNFVSAGVTDIQPLDFYPYDHPAKVDRRIILQPGEAGKLAEALGLPMVVV